MERKPAENTLRRPEAFAAIITQNPAMLDLFRYVETIAGAARTVLITGETGVGKELFARAFHAASGCAGAFVAVNVAGVDDLFFADTLFGHAPGAFTDAHEFRQGLIAQAENGTLFLDEIGDLSIASQIKLLRLLETYEYFPLGSDKPRRTNARIVVATNRSRQSLQEDSHFRNDLYYRLQTHHIQVPPLREHLDDLAVLTPYFLEKAAYHMDRKPPTAPPELLAMLATYHFPGNVRELEAMIADAVVRHQAHVLSLDRFLEYMNRPLSGNAFPKNPVELYADVHPLPTLKEAQRFLIAEALRRAQGNQSIAARLIGMTQSGLCKALKRMESAGTPGH